MLKQELIASAFADEHTSEIIQLIADYQRAAKIAVTSLKQQTKSNDLLGDYHAGAIPKRGTLLKPRGKYQFHGIGCLFEINKRIVDVDFGPKGRFDGFDVWRLHKYAESAFEWRDLTFGQIENGVRQLENAELIFRPGWELSEHLYFFKAD
jgi:hypothetical protein